MASELRTELVGVKEALIRGQLKNLNLRHVQIQLTIAVGLAPQPP
jgi:hypothetical protein